MSSLEQFIISVMRDERHGFFISILKGFLYILSLGYMLSVRVRNWLYDNDFFTLMSADLPVISVGNIVAGGSGKTPFTLYLAERLGKKQRVGILLRGYRSQAEKKELTTRVKFASTAEEVGDEAVLYFKRLPEAIVVVGRDRLKAAKIAQAAGAEILILDDGMQYRQMRRSVEIVIKPPFDTHYFLPRGFLRDDPKRLSEADVVVKTSIAEKKVIGWEGSSWPKSLEGEKIALFSGIAYPQGFKKTVEEMKAVVVHECHVPDHKRLEDKDLLEFSKEAKNLGATLLLCTEKDFVKMQEKPISVLPLAYLQISVEVVEGKEFIEGLVK